MADCPHCGVALRSSELFGGACTVCHGPIRAEFDADRPGGAAAATLGASDMGPVPLRMRLVGAALIFYGVLEIAFATFRSTDALLDALTRAAPALALGAPIFRGHKWAVVTTTVVCIIVLGILFCTSTVLSPMTGYAILGMMAVVVALIPDWLP